VNRDLISSSSIADQEIFYYDEFRTNIQQASLQLDETIKQIKDREDDSLAKIILYLYQGLFMIIDGEKKYRTSDYSGASNAYLAGEKMIVRFQRMSTNFPVQFQQEAERLDNFAKGRNFECLALKKGASIENQIENLLEAINSYTMEAQISEQIDRPLLKYNANARANFVRGLSFRIEGEQAFTKENFYLSKKKHLDAYRSFVKASYYNPSYSIWIKEQNDTIKNTMRVIIEQKASSYWKEAYKLSNEGKFNEQSSLCKAASKLYLRASNLAQDMKKAKILYSYSFMLKASMYEAIANDFVKNNNDAKGAIRQFELAAELMKQAIESFPQKEEDKITVGRWEAQQKYYMGNFHQAQGIFNLDSEKYQDAMQLFTQAESIFSEALKIANEIKDNTLIKLLEKSIAEAKGYIGMCKTVVE